MSLNLARLGTIQRRATSDFDPFAEAEARRRAQRDEKKFARDEEVAALNLARMKKDAAEATRLENEAAAERGVRSQYIQGRDFAQTAPVGVVNPRFLGKQEFGPQVEGGVPRDTSSVERDAVLNLSKINPMRADAFETDLRTRRESAEDRTRKIAGEDRTAKLAGDKFEWEKTTKDRELDEQERSNRANEYVRRLTAGNKTVKATADQNTYANYGRRLIQAEQDLNTLSQSGFDRTNPVMGLYNRLLPNMLQPGTLQQQNQAERNFVNAVLRRESGAVINPSEFANAEKQYFPRSGDSKETLAQKARNRQTVIESFKNLSGPAWQNAGGNPDVPEASAPTLSQEDQEALEWANANPNDPKSQKIKQSLGVE